MFYAVKQTRNMNYVLTVLYLLALLAGVICKAVLNAEDEDYSRYAYNYAVNGRLPKGNKSVRDDTAGYRTSHSLLGPDGNLRSQVEYNVDELNGFTDILNSLAASLKKPLPLMSDLPLPITPINPLIDPLLQSYGFGAAPLSVRMPKITVSGSSIPWDPKTRSYGGWVPLRKPARNVQYAKIVTKKYVNGHVYKVKSTSIPVMSNTIIVKRRPKSN